MLGPLDGPLLGPLLGRFMGGRLLFGLGTLFGPLFGPLFGRFIGGRLLFIGLPPAEFPGCPPGRLGPGRSLNGLSLKSFKNHVLNVLNVLMSYSGLRDLQDFAKVFFTNINTALHTCTLGTRKPLT